MLQAKSWVSVCKQNNTEKPPEYQAGFSYDLYLFSYVKRNVNILLAFPCYPSIWCFFPCFTPTGSYILISSRFKICLSLS